LIAFPAHMKEQGLSIPSCLPYREALHIGRFVPWLIRAP
jgi:hypothetical protein